MMNGDNSVATRLMVVTTTADQKEVREIYINYNVLLERITTAIDVSGNTAVSNVLRALREEVTELATVEGTVIVMDKEWQQARGMVEDGVPPTDLMEADGGAESVMGEGGGIDGNVQ